MKTKKTIFELHNKLNFIILHALSFISSLIFSNLYEVSQAEYFINNFTNPLIDFFKSDNYKISVISSILLFLFLKFKFKKYDQYKFISILFLGHAFYSFFIPYLTNIRESYLELVFIFIYLIFSISILFLKKMNEIDFIKLYFFFIFILIFSVFSKKINICLILSFIWILIYIITFFFIQKNQFKKYIILQKIKTIFCIFPYIYKNENIKVFVQQQLTEIVSTIFNYKFFFMIFILFFNFIPFTMFYLNYSSNSFFPIISLFMFVIGQIEALKYYYYKKRCHKTKKTIDVIFYVYVLYSFYHFDVYGNINNFLVFIIESTKLLFLYYFIYMFIPVIIFFTCMLIVYEIKTNECFNSIVKIKIINGLSFFINENNFNTIEKIQIDFIKQIDLNEDELLFLYKNFNFFHDGNLVVSNEILYSIVNKYRIAKQIKLKENLNLNDSFECLIEPYKESINKNKKIYNYLNS